MRSLIRLSRAFLLAISLVPAVWAQQASVGPPAEAPTASLCPSIEAYGGSTTSTDNSAALTAALRATSGDGRCVSFPPGRFAFASKFVFELPSGTAAVTLAGAGADVTDLYWPGGGGLTIDYVGAENSVHIRDMSLTTGTTAVGSAIVFNQTQGDIGTQDNALSDLTNVAIRGADGYSQTDFWKIAVQVEKVSNVNFMGLVVSGPGGAAYSTQGVGVELEGSAGDPSVVYNVSGATFNYLSKAIVYGQQVQGLSVSQSNFVGDEYGIYVQAGLSGLDQLTVQGSQFNCSTAGIYVGSYLSNTLFSGNLFIVPNTGTGVRLQQAYLFSLMGNSFNTGSSAKSTSYPMGIDIGNTVGGGTITGNLFDNMVTAIVLERGSTGVNVQSNEYSNDSTMVKNLGSGNVVGGGTP